MTASDTTIVLAPEIAQSAELDRQFPDETITLRQMLNGVGDLLEDPKHWTTGALARNAHGNSVSPTSADATCWCGIGATYKVYYDLTGKKETTDKRIVLKITQRLMQSSSMMLVGSRVENMNDAASGAENLKRVMPLAMALIEAHIENQQGALGEPLGAVSIVHPDVAEDEHAMVQDLPSINEAQEAYEAESMGGSGTGAPIPVSEDPLAGAEITQSQEASPPTSPQGGDESVTGPADNA
jgi:hypothetical protein